LGETSIEHGPRLFKGEAIRYLAGTSLYRREVVLVSPLDYKHALQQCNRPKKHRCIEGNLHYNKQDKQRKVGEQDIVTEQGEYVGKKAYILGPFAEHRELVKKHIGILFQYNTVSLRV
jgi:hypothetical protein